MAYLLPHVLTFTNSSNTLLVFKSYHFLFLLVSYTQTPSFEFFEKESAANKSDIAPNHSHISTRNSNLHADFESWQKYKNELRKNFKQRLIRICMEPSYPGVRISKAILKEFWPNKLSETLDFGEHEPFGAGTLLSGPVRIRLGQMAEVSNEPQLRLFLESLEGDGTRQRNMTQTTNREMSRTRWNRQNPFLNGSSETKKKSQIFGRKTEAPALNNLIDLDSLNNRSIRDSFQMKSETQNTYLLMLVLAYVDNLMMFMGPSQSIEFLLPVYFTILSVNANYHCQYKSVLIDKKPVVYLLIFESICL